MPGLKDIGLTLWRLWRVLDWRPIRREAETPVRLAVVGSGPAAQAVAELFTAAGGLIRGPLAMPLDGEPPDLAVLVVHDTSELATAATHGRSLAEREAASLLVLPPGQAPPASGTPYVVVDPGAPDYVGTLVNAILDALPEERRIAAARAAPALRAPLATRLIQEAAFANAQLALMTNLPSLLPGIGTAASLGADILVLTTNQIVLVFKLAAVWNQDLSQPRALIAEALPVVGSAFVWRTAARTAAGLVPAFMALAPKIAVAYVGTYVVGGLASAYYEHGLRPGKAQIEAIEAEARQALTRAWRRLRPAASGGAAEPADSAAAPGPAATPIPLPPVAMAPTPIPDRPSPEPESPTRGPAIDTNAR